MSGGFPDGTTLDEVIAAFDAQTFAPDDGVRYFHQLYGEVTREIARRYAAGGGFADPAFMAALDVEFAGLYFAALRAPDTAPRAWRAVFGRRTARLEPLRFALAGMNAHINRDLAVALDATFTRLGGAIERDSPRHRDFVAINTILETLMARAKTELFSPLDSFADSALGTLDDMLEAWSITAARDNAWIHGSLLHALGPGTAYDFAETSFDRTAALIGKMLLL
jgi:hypothetical protein